MTIKVGDLYGVILQGDLYGYKPEYSFLMLVTEVTEYRVRYRVDGSSFTCGEPLSEAETKATWGKWVLLAQDCTMPEVVLPPVIPTRFERATVV